MPVTLSVQKIANAIAETEPELRADLVDAIEEYLRAAKAAPYADIVPAVSGRVRRLQLFREALGG